MEKAIAFQVAAGASQVLGVCEKAEFACAELYHHFANQFKDDREIFYIWLKSALERENRARLLTLVGKLALDDVIAGVHLELAEAEEVLAKVRASLDVVKEEPPEVREALQLAMDLERTLDRITIEKVVQFTESYQKWFLSIMNRDQMELLQNAYKQHGRD
ncbi:rubrerythrin [Geomonas subterranea]|uniref:Rubrerythrin n=1 Tax=Geomonas subterranea TaxID=2847989 RepID=A0ABX8LD16_9BACT|nr:MULTISPECIES: rubrerythrin [Geomonas]QXE89314.1 rubrerythrin [Geomonas subterranea]QXM08572.1 rubrerythrin [Geomonas subterranea]